MKFLIISIATLLIGAVSITIGILLLTFFPLRINNEVAKRIYLGYNENGTYNDMTLKWIDPEYSMMLQIWIFSLENEEDVIKNGAFPNFTQKGPYSFTEVQHKEHINFLMNATRVTYRNKRFYTFDANSSCASCSLEDQVTFPNVVFQKLVDIALDGGLIVKEAIEFVLQQAKRETPFITTSVGEMLFDGYKDPLIEEVCSKPFVRPFCIAAGIPMKIGFLLDRNATDDGEYLVGTGLNDRSTISKVYKWNGMSSLPVDWWSSDWARMINGTDAQLFPPSLSTKKDLFIFIGLLKRSIYMRYKMSEEVEDVPVLRFSPPAEQYDYFLDENKGFCNPSTPTFFDNITQPEGCLPAGLMDISRTLPGKVRVYLSGSHFLNSPAVLYQNFSGFGTPSTDDETFIDIEPTSGLPVQAISRSQINVGMISGNLRILSNMRNLIMPVLWMNETVRFDVMTRQQLLDGFVTLKHKVFIIGMLLLTIGLLLWVIFILVSLIRTYIARSDEEAEQLIVQEDNENDDGEN